MPSIDTYRASIRASIRGLWSNRLTEADFFNAMSSAINRGFTQAWLIGARDCAKNINDLTLQEHTKLALFISEQLAYVPKLGKEIAAADKAQGGLLGKVISRADLWTNKWDQVRATAEAFCKADEPREFVLGPTKEKCRSCIGLSGRVYRLSTWQANNAIPPTHRTQCRGYRCQCRLMPTTKPITKGKFPVSLLAR